MRTEPSRSIAAGVGKRGASAIDRLVANGRVANAEVWCVDSDRRALDACAASHTLLLSDQQVSEEVTPGHIMVLSCASWCSSLFTSSALPAGDSQIFAEGNAHEPNNPRISAHQRPLPMSRPKPVQICSCRHGSNDPKQAVLGLLACLRL